MEARKRVDRQVNQVQSEGERQKIDLVNTICKAGVDLRSDNGNVIFCGSTNELFFFFFSLTHIVRIIYQNYKHSRRECRHQVTLLLN